MRVVDLDHQYVLHDVEGWAETGAMPMVDIAIALKFLASLNEHIYHVRFAGLVIGVPPKQLIEHDASKLSLAEFPHYCRQFFGDGADPEGFAAAWLHHENFNPHHWGHWVARSGKYTGEPLPMPERYVREMVADWHGAGKAYQGSYNISGWIAKNGPGFLLHDTSERLVAQVMAELGYHLTDNCMWSYMAGPRVYELFNEPLPADMRGNK